MLESGKDYYARFELNHQKIAFFFKAQSENLAKITKIKPEDLISYNAFVVEIQRNAIREKRKLVMGEELLYLVFIVILFAAIVAYMYLKDKEQSLKLSKFESVVEDMSKELHYVKKELLSRDAFDEEYNNELLRNEMQILLEKEVANKILPILKSLQGMEHIIEQFQNEQQERLLSLEQKAQSITKLTPNYDAEEQKIIDLFKEGKSIEQIAKDLRIGTGNVELVLKFKKIIK